MSFIVVETFNEFVNKIENIEFSEMNSPGNNKISRLFYGTEDIMALQKVDYNHTKYENIKEILNNRRHIEREFVNLHSASKKARENLSN